MRSLLLLLLLLLLAAAAPVALAVEVHEVPTEFATVQAAIDAAEDGDVIAIRPGTYTENILIVGKELTLQSDFATSGDPADVLATVLEAALVLDDNGTPGVPGDDELVPGDVIEVQRRSSGGVVKPSHVVLVGLTVRNGGSGVLIRPDCLVEFLDGRVVGHSDGVELEGRNTPEHGFARAVVKRSVIEGNDDDGVDVDQRAQLLIEDSTIQDNGQDGIEIRLQDNVFDAGEMAEHVIRRNHLLRNGQDGLQLIDYYTLTPRSIRVERNLFAGNLFAGIGMMCDEVTNENFEGCPILERVTLLHNTFVANDHGLTGGANLVGVGNLFARQTNLGVKKVVSPSLLAHSLFHDNGTDHDVDSNLEVASTVFADPLLTADHELSAGSAAVDAGTAFFSVPGETILDLDPCDYRGLRPDLGMHELDTGPALLDEVEVMLAAGSDDAAQKGSKVKTTGKRLDLGSSKGDGVAGWRFDGIDILQGADVLAAHLEFTAAKKGTKPAALVIHGEASDDALPFSAAANDLSARARTTASVSWDPPLWPDKDTDQQTPDLAAVVDEIVDRPGWEAGNALALFVTGTGKRAVSAFEGETALPLLHIEIAASGGACAP